MRRTETIEINGKTFTRTYSDAHRYVVGGEPQGEYIEAVDPAELGRTYTEGDIIPDEAPADNNTPAWDISQGEYIPAGFLLNRDGVTYECIAGHYAAWNKQPPNETYWKEAF